MLCGSTPSIVGKCRGKGDIARLTPVIVGSRWGHTSFESFLCLQPRGFIVVTNDSCGVWGSACSIR